jgi:serine/threonine protein kinase
VGWVGLSSERVSHSARGQNLLWSEEELRCYYENLRSTTVGARYFPSITAYRDGGENVNFKYSGFLENDPSCTAIRARTCTEPARDIVVKFVDRYGERAHQILAEAGLAPKLWYCGPLQIDKGQPSYSPLRMVVMEYIDGSTLIVGKSELDAEATKRVREEVQRALDLLHARRLVFGDLRPPNVMITKAMEVKLIDFDWAGEHGQAKYPCLLSPNVHWPAGVKALDVIEYAHDKEMLDRLL